MKPNPIFLLVIFALLVFVALQTEQKFNQQQQRFTAERVGDSAVFAWRDEVEFPMSLRLQETFDEWKGEVDRIVIDLSSPGGSVSEGRQVIQVIDDMKRSHLVETRVRARRFCLSMCVPIYLQGEMRVAAPTSQWMFHQPSAVDAITGEPIRTPQLERQYETQKFVDRYFKQSDMDPLWLEKLEAEWDGKDIWKTGRQLFDEESGIILEIR